MSEHWCVRIGKDSYIQWLGGALTITSCREQRYAYVDRKNACKGLRWAKRGGYDTPKLIHVRIRPRSERLYLAARLAAWEPVVRAAMAWQALGRKGFKAQIENAHVVNGNLDVAVRAVAKEHRPVVA